MGIGGHDGRFTELILMNPREGGTGYGVLISLISRAFAFDTGELLVLTPFIMQVGRGEGGEGGVGGEGRVGRKSPYAPSSRVCRGGACAVGVARY